MTKKDSPQAGGRPPVKGRDGYVDYKFSVEKQEREFKRLPDGRIDYRSLSSIISAKKGQLLAEIVLPGPGAEGMDVYGRAIPAPPGAKASLTAGGGISVSDDGTKFYAAIDGQIILKRNFLEVMKIYILESDVDPSSGNIDFNGSVIITGNVREGLSVRADGDIMVLKKIEPSARLEAGRDITVTGGVQGRGKGLLIAGGDITVEYTMHAHLEAQGCIIIRDFAVNSRLMAGRILKMQSKHGMVIGGRIYAQYGIDVRELGSPWGTRTYVEAGTDFLQKKKIAELEVAMAFCAENIQKIDTAVKPMLELMKTNPKAVAARRAIIKTALDKKKELEARAAAMESMRKHLSDQVGEGGVCLVKVNGFCHNNVTIRIQDVTSVVKIRRRNVRFFYDVKTGTIKAGLY